MAGEAEQSRPGRLRGADGGERRAAVENDVRNVRQRLDVVDDGRFAEEAGMNGEWRLVARLAAITLDRIEDGRFLTADVRGAAAAHQFRRRHFRNHGFRSHRARLPERGETARGSVRVEALRIDAADAPE